ncbi:MAG: hypothetical protein ABJB12_12155 [Pseudomonadota bacterium]
MQWSLTGLALHGLLACSVPEAAAPASNEMRGRETKREPSAADRRRERIQNQILSELRELKESRAASAGVTEPARAQTPKPAAYKFLIFGGANHEVYLGCMCDGQEAESVFNLGGEFGSASSANSMRNKSGPYGSRHADTSACSATATRPPSVVAADGKSLGFLTLNKSLKKRIVSASVSSWLARMCSF